MLIEAGCVTATIQRTEEVRYRHALYVATGTPYAARPGRPVDPESQNTRRVASRAWVAENKAHVLAYHRQYVKDHKDERTAYKRAYYAANLSAAARKIRRAGSVDVDNKDLPSIR